MKWLFRILGIVLSVLVVGLVALFFLPADRIAKIATDQLRVVTGREVSISGDVSLSFFPVLGVSADGLEVGNADWSEQGPMLSAENAAIGIDAMALLQGEIRITNIEATSPTIRLEQRLDGRASWQFSDASGEATIETETDPDRPAQAFSIARLAVTDATFIYDAEGSDLVSYSGVDLTLDWPDRDGAAQLSARLQPEAAPVTFDATIDRFAGFITGQVQPVAVQIGAGSSSVDLRGRASTAGEVAGRLTLDIPDTDAFFRALALPAPGLPAGLGRTMAGQMDLTLTPDRRLALRDVSLDLGGNQISGAADISLNGIPQINAQLDAGALDLSSVTGSDGGSGSGGGGSSGWSKDPIDASGLAAFNGEIALRAASVDLGDFKLGPTRTLLRNDNSRMVFELREVQAYRGTVTGEFVVNNRNGLSVGGNMNVAALSLQDLLRDAIDVSQLTGAANGSLKFLGVGQNMDAIMRSLSGQGSLNVGKGTIEGIDLDGLLKNGRGNGRTTVFETLSASFRMDKGNLFNSDLTLLLRSFEAKGEGRIGLGAQDIDYLFTPTALKGSDGQGVAIPVRIRGPWSGPSILPDLDAAVRLNFEAEKDRIREEAKDKLRERVAEEVGVSTGDGVSLEDAAKSKVENEIKKGLRSLFD